MLKVQAGVVADSKLRMLLKTIVAVTSPWVRIPRPPLTSRNVSRAAGRPGPDRGE